MCAVPTVSFGMMKSYAGTVNSDSEDFEPDDEPEEKPEKEPEKETPEKEPEKEPEKGTEKEPEKEPEKETESPEKEEPKTIDSKDVTPEVTPEEPKRERSSHGDHSYRHFDFSEGPATGPAMEEVEEEQDLIFEATPVEETTPEEEPVQIVYSSKLPKTGESNFPVIPCIAIMAVVGIVGIGFANRK